MFDCHAFSLSAHDSFIIIELWAIEKLTIEHRGVVSVRAEKFFLSFSYALVIELFIVALVWALVFELQLLQSHQYCAVVSSDLLFFLIYRQEHATDIPQLPRGPCGSYVVFLLNHLLSQASSNQPLNHY